jgi:hypothetical protein
MRRIMAISIVGFAGFWAVFWLFYGIMPWFAAAVNGFAFNVAGPTLFNMVSAAYLGVVNAIGIPGLVGIFAFAFLIVGIYVHKLWVSADWRIRRWGQSRTAQDLGIPSMSQFPQTPSGATTRPEATAPPVTEPAKTETKAEETTT